MFIQPLNIQSEPTGPLAALRRPLDPTRFKTRHCGAFNDTSACQYGSRCMFAHGDSDLRSVEDNIRDGLTTDEALRAFQRSAARSAHQVERQRLRRRAQKERCRQRRRTAIAAASAVLSVAVAPESKPFRGDQESDDEWAEYDDFYFEGDIRPDGDLLDDDDVGANDGGDPDEEAERRQHSTSPRQTSQASPRLLDAPVVMSGSSNAMTQQADSGSTPSSNHRRHARCHNPYMLMAAADA